MASRRGFASWTPERLREVASEAGRKAQATGHGHRFTKEEQKRGGKCGGTIVSQNRWHMATIGREGGLATHRKKWTEEGNGDQG